MPGIIVIADKEVNGGNIHLLQAKARTVIVKTLGDGASNLKSFRFRFTPEAQTNVVRPVMALKVDRNPADKMVNAIAIPDVRRKNFVRHQSC